MIVLLNKRDAAARIGVNPATLMRMAKEGRFPVPVRLSDHLLAEHRFIESEVEEWVQDRIAARDAMANREIIEALETLSRKLRIKNAAVGGQLWDIK